MPCLAAWPRSRAPTAASGRIGSRQSAEQLPAPGGSSSAVLCLFSRVVNSVNGGANQFKRPLNAHWRRNIPPMQNRGPVSPLRC